MSSVSLSEVSGINKMDLSVNKTISNNCYEQTQNNKVVCSCKAGINDNGADRTNGAPTDVKGLRPEEIGSLLSRLMHLLER